MTVPYRPPSPPAPAAAATLTAAPDGTGIRWSMPPSLREHFEQVGRARRAAEHRDAGAVVVPADLGRRLGVNPPAAPPSTGAS